MIRFFLNYIIYFFQKNYRKKYCEIMFLYLWFIDVLFFEKENIYYVLKIKKNIILKNRFYFLFNN